MKMLRANRGGVGKLRGIMFGLKRIIVYWGLYWGPPILGHYQIAP